jgi:hypothetical protein
MKTTCDKCSRVIEDCDGRWVGGLAMLCNQCGTKDGSKGGGVKERPILFSGEITPIQSARLNMTMAIKDLQFALDSFDREELAWASLCIGNAIEHLTAAKAKIVIKTKGGPP